MSIKRQATTELNHENWDQDDPSEHEEMGTFKTASKDILEKRVIKTAKRRTIGTSNDEPKKSLFSGFGGFNKTQPPSFDFLSNLTKETKSNGATTNDPQTNTKSLSKPTSTSGIGPGGLFSSLSPTSSNNLTLNPPKSSLFSTTGSTPTSSVFGMKTGSTLTESPFKIPTVSNNSSLKLNNSPSKPSILGATPTTNKLFSTTNSTSTPFKTTQQNTMDTVKENSTTKESTTTKKENSSEISEYQLKYYNKLKTLNESVSDWIRKHVDTTPLCILSPIFKDYENHLKVIQDEFEKAKQAANATEDKNEQVSEDTATLKKSETSPFANTKTSTFYNSNFASAKPDEAGIKDKGFSFGIKPPTSNASSFGSSPGISFGTTTTTSPFAPSTNTQQSSPTAPFSFGIGKPFSFNVNVQKPVENTQDNEKDAEDEPPKVEYTPIAEENSVFDKKCKIFVKKDGNFADKGVGTLYIKKIEETGKHQLLVRANTTMGNVLLNFILSSSIPTQRMGKNNVMMVCIPTPEAKPPPTPILIRVKTSEEADELLETLNKYKA